MQNYRKTGATEPFTVLAGAAVTKNNLVALDTGDAKNITNGAKCLGVALNTGAAGATVNILRKDVVIDVKAAAGVAFTQGDVVYATGSFVLNAGRYLPEVDAGAQGEFSVGVVVDADIATAGIGKIRTTPSDFYNYTTHA